MEDSILEKRRHVRIPRKLDVQLKIELRRIVSGKISQQVQNIVALAQTSNISIGGMLLAIVGGVMDARQSLTPANAPLVIGQTIEVIFSYPVLTVWGHVIRADTASLALVIDKVSNVRLWKQVCAENREGVSIFPDGARIRRKRRS